ncbi:hypothetical protein B0H16DRAFT_1468073 [Mycena metata]|uniref:Uncharacterized protein n=1 Tax=Mycena metata TaxID=1033252 RepID=A0AAD7I472_9AGAR|nr:hypothetical protein B0H16DRAFT_1468073 [Mycena metata]
MARAAKSSKTTRSGKKRCSTNQFIDDEAEESTEGDVVGDVDASETLSGESARCPRAALTLYICLRSKNKGKSRRVDPQAVIDVTNSSGEECHSRILYSLTFADRSNRDMAAIARDDRMFPKPNGVKSTMLPAPLTTRSATTKRASTDVASGSGIVKKAKVATRVSSSKAVDSQDPDEDEMSDFMTAWKLHKAARATTNHVELSEDDGSVSRAENNTNNSKLKSSQKQIKVEKNGGGAPKYSPDWDPPDGVLDEDSAETKATSGAAGARLNHDTEGEDSDTAASREKRVSLQRDKTGKRAAAAKDATEVDSASRDTEMANPIDPDETPSTVFLEDLETYKAYFDPSAECGVADPDLQDPALIPGYAALHPLPAGRRILPSFDPQGVTESEGDEGIKGGRVKFSSWTRHLRNMLADNSIGALIFKESEPNFINPSRVSPLRLSSQSTTAASPTQRLMVESVLVEAAKISPKSERMRKWVSGVFHNQEWERFESLMCLVFGEDLMYTQISPKKAVSFQTMLSPDSAGAVKDTDSRFKAEAPSDMFTPIKSKAPKKASPSKPSIKTKTLLAYNEDVPIYDARKVVVDFQADLGRLNDVLPKFIGEIPFSSFVVVGYTASCYKGARGGSAEKVAQLGCNIVWVIVCGTPVKRR